MVALAGLLATEATPVKYHWARPVILVRWEGANTRETAKYRIDMRVKRSASVGHGGIKRIDERVGGFYVSPRSSFSQRGARSS